MFPLLLSISTLITSAVCDWRPGLGGLPTQDQCDAAFSSPAPDTCIFYSGGPDGSDAAANYARTLGVTIYSQPDPDANGWANGAADTPASYHLSDDLTTTWAESGDLTTDDNDYIRYFQRISTSYTKKCSGKVIVVTPYAGWYDQSIWALTEYPIIQADRGRYPEVLQVFYDNPAVTSTLYPCNPAPTNRAAKRRQAHSSKQQEVAYRPVQRQAQSREVKNDNWAAWLARTRAYPVMPRWANTTVAPVPIGTDGCPEATTMTTVEPDGSTITGVFTPTTLEPYTTLTTTTTITTTGSDGIPTPLIIGPGGVAWGPDGSVPAGITAPPGPPAEAGPSNPSEPGETTLTATEPDGTVETGVFTSTTISQYTSLTSTTTITTEDSNGTPFPLVIGPGGVAWAPLGVVPAIIAGGPAIPPTPTIPDGSGGDNPDEPDETDEPDSCALPRIQPGAELLPPLPNNAPPPPACQTITQPNAVCTLCPSSGDLACSPFDAPPAPTADPAPTDQPQTCPDTRTIDGVTCIDCPNDNAACKSIRCCATLGTVPPGYRPPFGDRGPPPW